VQIISCAPSILQHDTCCCTDEYVVQRYHDDALTRHQGSGKGWSIIKIVLHTACQAGRRSKLSPGLEKTGLFQLISFNGVGAG